MASRLKLPRGTLSSLNTLAGSLGLIPYQQYYLTDQGCVAIATSTSTFVMVSGKTLSFFCSGVPGNDEVIGGGLIPFDLTINQSKCAAKSLVAATASTALVIKRNGTQIGTITFAAAGTTGTFSFTQTAMLKDQFVTIHNPAAADATLSTISGFIRHD